MSDRAIRWWTIAAIEITLLTTAPFLIRVVSKLP
jgi:hypothetical protein